MRRFVFLVSKTGDEVLDGATIEIRAETPEDAATKTSSWMIAREGAEFRLIGERLGFKSTARFIAAVPRSEIPEHVAQNERVIYAEDEVAA